MSYIFEQLMWGKRTGDDIREMSAEAGLSSHFASSGHGWMGPPRAYIRARRKKGVYAWLGQKSEFTKVEGIGEKGKTKLKE